MVVSFPNLHRLGMANLGFMAALEAFDSIEGISCERAFLPERDMVAEYRRSGLPLLTLEGPRPVREALVWAFSISFELDYPNMLAMLELAGVPFDPAERTASHPLVVVGGAISMINPEPIDPFADLVFVGEIEAGFDQIAEELLDPAWRSNRGELGRLERSTRGVYVPSMGLETGPTGVARRVEPVYRAFPERLDFPPLATRLTTTAREFKRMELMEVSRGCMWGCRFCRPCVSSLQGV